MINLRWFIKSKWETTRDKFYIISITP
jgi:hypothetical protein